MIVKLCQMTNKHFSPLMIVLVLVGVLANFVAVSPKRKPESRLTGTHHAKPTDSSR